ncbi:MAG: hypothetical protein KDN18_19645 [Verrucomicrobiae bacterium]|nr:hypothetical protein [Verrucomicrobiae bacterium]
MKPLIALVAALLATFVVNSPVEAGYPARFRGVCQQCGHDLMAYYRPVECLDGRVVLQWVNECHDHCRPAYLGKKKADFFNSHLMNPANPKRNAKRNCLPLRAESTSSGKPCCR